MNRENDFIATFHSHYGALLYCQTLEAMGIAVTPMPVPRKLSVSCGTCVSYHHGIAIDVDDCELDAVYLAGKDGYRRVIEK